MTYLRIGSYDFVSLLFSSFVSVITNTVRHHLSASYRDPQSGFFRERSVRCVDLQGGVQRINRVLVPSTASLEIPRFNRHAQ